MNALILCNGKPPPQPLFEQSLSRSDLFIAADGGANSARKLGQPPDVVIGDLDSYEEQAGDDFEIIHKPSQYANDLEKALDLAQERGATKVRVLGATGQRLDHTLKNLSVLKQYNDKFEHIIFRDDYGSTQLLPASFSMSFPVGTALSLFPLSGKVTGLTTQGLKYNLDNGFLENGVSDGSSNTVVSSPVTISYTTGDLLLFIAK